MTTVGDLTKIAEGREAELFQWEEGKVLRLMRDGYGPETVEHQARALEAAHSAGVAVPAAMETTVVDGRHGLVMEKVEGVDLLTLIGTKPWHIWSAGTATGRLQAKLHNVQAPAGLPNLKNAMAETLRTSDLIPNEIAEYALGMLTDLPDGDRLCHGDYHPGNVMQTDEDYIIIDWSNACAGDPGADLAYVDLVIKLGDPPPGSPFLIRALATVGRGLLGAAIRRGYRSVADVDQALVRRWMIPVAAHRLLDNIEPERPKLLKLLNERMETEA